LAFDFLNEWEIAMNDQWNFEGENDGTDGPKALRDAYAAQKKQNEELAAQLSEMQRTVKGMALNSTFDSLGVPAEVRSMYSGEADPQKATEWVNQMRTAFGGAPQGAPTPPVAQPPATPPVAPETVNALQQFSAAGAGEHPSTNMDELMQGVAGAGSIQDLIANFNRAH